MGAIDALSALASVPDLSDPTTPLANVLGEAGPAMEQLGGIGSGLRDLIG